MLDPLEISTPPTCDVPADLATSDRTGSLVLMRREYERIIIGNEFTVEVLDIKPGHWETSGGFARLLFGFTLEPGKHVTLHSRCRTPASVTGDELSVRFLETVPAQECARVALCGSANIWQELLPDNEPTLQTLPDGAGISVCRKKLQRVQLGPDFFVTVAAISKKRTRLEINAKLYEGDHFDTDAAVVSVVAVERNRVRIGTRAPADLSIDREEIAFRRAAETALRGSK